jgi:hypothetical protein
MTPRFRRLHDLRIDVPTLTRPSKSYDKEQYDIDTSIGTIWVNAHNTVLAHYGNGTRVSDDA